ncbi:MAG TPA: PLDc N-terminal domain-containing protein [Candidatus Hydrogenedentes bacterium]|nr:PLDc N-terminal domain-containing protein [Candidatus Hydrogenedentota bacterium]
MKTLGAFSMLGVCLALVMLSACWQAWAQQQMSDAEAAASCAACGGFFFFIIIAGVVINILILVWVARDAKARGMDGAVLWMLLVFFTGLIGLVIYLLARPQGALVQCPHCNNKRLQASAVCPHCGNQ